VSEMLKHMGTSHCRCDISWRSVIKICVYLMIFYVVVLAVCWVFMPVSIRAVDYGTFRQSPCSSTVISMATFGSRVFNTARVIKSLLEQTTSVDLIVVHVALASMTGNISRESVFVYFSDTLETCRSTPDINGIRCERNVLILYGPDFGPATKVLGTVLALPDLDAQSCIISVDDNVVYNEHLVLTLVSNAPPHDAALGFGCEELSVELDFVRFFFPGWLRWRTINEHSRWQFPFDNIVECKGWMQGYLGVLYRRQSFGDDIFSMTQTMPDGCFYADDVRLSGYLQTKGIMRFVLIHDAGDGYRAGSVHMMKNASDALSVMKDSMRVKQFSCVNHFQWG
jgi:hypothetical protein